MKRLTYLLLLGIIASCTNTTTPEIDQEDRPEANRFSQFVLTDGLEEPMQIEFDQRGYVYWVERAGLVKRIPEDGGPVEALAKLPVSLNPAPGLIGILLDAEFDNNGWIYLYYSAADDQGQQMRLSRFQVASGDTLDMTSEIVMLKLPWEQPDGAHMGGGMCRDKAGNLYLSVGGDTQPSQYEPIHYLGPDSTLQDAARAAGNTNDLRGAILRIHPEPDGSYTIPAGNLFPEGTPNTRPEIYTMGNRNPWRLSIDSQTGYLHWGEVGPDAGADSEEFGPMGYDEFNIAKQAGNYGWPFVIGYNRPYPQYNYPQKKYGTPIDPQAPVNTSPNNTGQKVLPPAQPPVLAYPYGVSNEWPLLNSGARSAVGGPIFHRSDFAGTAKRVFPAYYEGKWIITDYVRNWIMVLSLNEERTAVTAIEPLVPASRLSHHQPLDMDFSPNGDLYLLEYGTGRQGRISRIEYNAGNRAPEAQLTADHTSGAVPLQVQLSAGTASDPDGDQLQYSWKVSQSGEPGSISLSGTDPRLDLTEAGKYLVELTLTDPSGASDQRSLEVVAGNEHPVLQFTISSGNRSFYFPDGTISYALQLTDREDGKLQDGSIPAEQLHLTAEYLPAGITPTGLQALKEKAAAHPGTPLRFLQAQDLMTANNCRTCHAVDNKLIGPGFKMVADTYHRRPGAADTLTHSILNGSVGTWGEVPMPAHPMLSAAQAGQIAAYILSLAQAEAGLQELPITGRFTTKAYKPTGNQGRIARYFQLPYERGAYILQAQYTDRGSSQVAGLELTAEDLMLLRYPLIAPEEADIFSEKGILFTPSTDDPGFTISGREAYIGFRQLDLTGINQISVAALTRFWHWSHYIGGTIELRLDSPDGQLVGSPQERVRPASMTAADGPFFGRDLDLPVEIDVSGVDGLHDIYLVFRNPGAGDSDALLLVTGIEFKQ